MWTRLFFCFIILLFSCTGAQKALLLQKTIISKDNPKIQLQLFYNKTDLSLWDIWQIKFVFTYPTTYQIQGKYLNFNDYQPLFLFTTPIEKNNFKHKQNSWEKSLTYLLEAPKAGVFALQEREFVFKNLITLEKILLKTPSIPLQVSTTISGGSSLLKIKGAISKDTSTRYYWILVIAFLLLVSYYLWKKKEVKTEKITITKWALQELKQLQKNNLVTTKEIKHYHLALSSILRKFFEQQFAIQATAQTKEEFLQEIAQNKRLQKKYKYLLEQYLELNDLAKFANYRPSTKNNSEIFALVKKIITFYHKQHQK